MPLRPTPSTRATFWLVLALIAMVFAAQPCTSPVCSCPPRRDLGALLRIPSRERTREPVPGRGGRTPAAGAGLRPGRHAGAVGPEPDGRAPGQASCSASCCWSSPPARAGAGRRHRGAPGRRLAGRPGRLVAYYAIGDYHALVPMIMMAGPARLAVRPRLASGTWRARRSWDRCSSCARTCGRCCRSVLLLARRRARGWTERLLVAAVMIVPPLIFLAWDVRHLKLLPRCRWWAGWSGPWATCRSPCSTSGRTGTWAWQDGSWSG